MNAHTLLAVAAAIPLAACGGGGSAVEWQSRSVGLEGGRVTSLAIDALGALYAGTSSNGVQRRADGGASWTATGALPGATVAPLGGTAEVAALAVDPVVATNVYAGLRGGGVWKSADSGAGAGGKLIGR
jgi:hypothetical protein